MVSDNPFDEPVIPLRDLGEAPRARPILRTASEGDLHAAHLAATAAGPSDSSGATLAPDMNTGGTGSAGTSSPAEHVVASVPARTPRRVQWTQDHVVNLAPMADDREAQLDHRNIREVNDALEHFKKHRPGQRSSLSISSMASDELEHEHGHGQHHRHHLHGLGRHHSHGTENAVSDEDYDYRLDHDPPEEEGDGNDLERTEGELLGEGANDHVTSYVPIGETDGLPSLPTEPDAAKEAANLVRGHTGRWGTLRQRVRSGAVKRARKQEEEQPREHDTEKEARSSLNPHPQAGKNKPNAPSPLNTSINPPPGSGLPPIPGGTSVLGTLLQLYNQQNLDSAGTTPASTAPPSRSSSFDEDDEKTLHSASWSERHFPWRRRAHSTDDFGAHKRNDSSVSVADRPYSPDEPGLLNSFHRAIGRVRDDRPKAARSGAGVFGALIQNSGAVAAAAAPVSSTLMPSASKRGYHLKRYTLAGDSPSASRPASRPTSLYSHEDSPTNSEFKKSDATITMHPTHSKSSDDLLMMNTKHKNRPMSINLQKSAEKWIRPLVATPEREVTGDSYFKMSEDERRRKEWEQEKRRRKKAKEARRKQEVFIIQHVATIIARQQFLMKLARALMMFGSPSHRLETQIQATARVLEINAQVVYLPGTMLISFADDATHTSETKFMKQDTGLNLGKLLAVHNVYWDVVHDKASVEDANRELDVLMTSKPHYNAWQTILIGGLCSSFIVIPSFYGSFLDALMCAPLGMLLVAVQLLAAKNDMFSNVFEITIATVISFLAAVLGSTSYFCYTALVSGGIVLVLPGYIVLTGALEIASRNITAGSVRIAYSVMYSLFLGFGISIGAEIYIKIRGQGVANAEDYQCKNTHYEGAPWYLQTPSGYWYYLCVPGYSLVLSLRNQQPIFRRELPIMVAIACAGWVTNHFAAQAFRERSDIISALGSFCVGILGNLYGRFLSNGASFPVMVTGILFQLPSGLSQGGLFTFASDSKNGSASQYSQGFGVAQQLVSVAIGLTVGLFVSATLMYPLGGSRRRGAGIFSF